MSTSIIRYIYGSAQVMLILCGGTTNTVAGRLAVGELYLMTLIFLICGLVVFLITAISGRVMIADLGVISKKLK